MDVPVLGEVMMDVTVLAALGAAAAVVLAGLAALLVFVLRRGQDD